MSVESAGSVLTSEDPDSLDAPSTELTAQVQLDGSDPSKCVGIGTKLKGCIRRELICFLKRNKSTFAWSTEDMPGISIDVTSHQLNFDPSFIPVKQKKDEGLAPIGHGLSTTKSKDSSVQIQSAK